jgi:hypothetical protein
MLLIGGIHILRVLATLSEQMAAVGFNVPDQFAQLHAAANEIFSFSENSSGAGVPESS